MAWLGAAQSAGMAWPAWQSKGAVRHGRAESGGVWLGRLGKAGVAGHGMACLVSVGCGFGVAGMARPVSARRQRGVAGLCSGVARPARLGWVELGKGPAVPGLAKSGPAWLAMLGSVEQLSQWRGTAGRALTVWHGLSGRAELGVAGMAMCVMCGAIERGMARSGRARLAWRGEASQDAGKAVSSRAWPARYCKASHIRARVWPSKAWPAWEEPGSNDRLGL